MPTYRGSVPVYSSTTKNWFHTQPRFTRPAPGAPSCRVPGAAGAGVPAAHRRPGSGGGGGSNSSSSSAGDSAAPARSPRPSGRGLMLGLRRAGTREPGREAPWRRRSVARRSGPASHGGFSAAAGARPPTGHPDWPAALRAAQRRGRPAAGEGARPHPGHGRPPGSPPAPPSLPPRPDHQAAPPRLPRPVCAMVPAQRAAGWGPADPRRARGGPEPARETREHQRRRLVGAGRVESTSHLSSFRYQLSPCRDP